MPPPEVSAPSQGASEGAPQPVAAVEDAATQPEVPMQDVTQPEAATDAAATGTQEAPVGDQEMPQEQQDLQAKAGDAPPLGNEMADGGSGKKRSRNRSRSRSRSGDRSRRRRRSFSRSRSRSRGRERRRDRRDEDSDFDRWGKGTISISWTSTLCAGRGGSLGDRSSIVGNSKSAARAGLALGLEVAHRAEGVR